MKKSLDLEEANQKISALRKNKDTKSITSEVANVLATEPSIDPKNMREFVDDRIAVSNLKSNKTKPTVKNPSTSTSTSKKNKSTTKKKKKTNKKDTDTNKEDNTTSKKNKGTRPNQTDNAEGRNGSRPDHLTQSTHPRLHPPPPPYSQGHPTEDYYHYQHQHHNWNPYHYPMGRGFGRGRGRGRGGRDGWNRGGRGRGARF